MQNQHPLLLIDPEKDCYMVPDPKDCLDWWTDRGFDYLDTSYAVMNCVQIRHPEIDSVTDFRYYDVTNKSLELLNHWYQNGIDILLGWRLLSMMPSHF